MNALTGAGVFVEDALFATLDTRTRRWQLPGWGPVLLSDTVGFIRDLPHHLIESFQGHARRSPQAHLLLHVADGANPAVGDQIAAAYRVLEEIGIQQKDTLLLINKVDALADRIRLDGLLGRYPDAVPIRRPHRLWAVELVRRGERCLKPRLLDVDVEFSVENGRLLAYLAAHGEVSRSTTATTACWSTAASPSNTSAASARMPSPFAPTATARRDSRNWRRTLPIRPSMKSVKFV